MKIYNISKGKYILAEMVFRQLIICDFITYHTNTSIQRCSVFPLTFPELSMLLLHVAVYLNLHIQTPKNIFLHCQLFSITP